MPNKFGIDGHFCASKTCSQGKYKGRQTKTHGHEQ